MQINYHSVLTKIQKLQNFKKNKNKNKNKTFFVPANISQNWPIRPIFKPVQNVDVSIPVYIPTDTADINMVLTTLDLRHPSNSYITITR